MRAEPIESEYRTSAPMMAHEVFRDGRKHTVFAVVPDRCRRAWWCLSGQYYDNLPPLVRETGRWRYIDVIMTTGHQCDDRKLRELVELNPDLFEIKEHRSHSGSRYNTFRLIVDVQGQLF